MAVGDWLCDAADEEEEGDTEEAAVPSKIMSKTPPKIKIAGMISISGVYTLLRPLGGALNKTKNRVFDALYRKKVFGSDLVTLAAHSPTALLRLGSGEKAPFEESRCRLCRPVPTAPMYIT